MFLIAPEDGGLAVRVPGGGLHVSTGSISLALDLPWFIACVAPGQDEPPRRTVLLALDSALVSLALDSTRGSITSLLAVAPSESGGWTVTEISEVWMASAEESLSTGPLLLRSPNKPDLFTCWNERVIGQAPGRRLVLRLERSS